MIKYIRLNFNFLEFLLNSKFKKNKLKILFTPPIIIIISMSTKCYIYIRSTILFTISSKHIFYPSVYIKINNCSSYSL